MAKKKPEKPEFDISNLAAQVEAEEWMSKVMAPMMGKTYKNFIDQEIPPEHAAYLTGIYMQSILGTISATISAR